MFRHYLKVAWRGFKRASVFSFINITGLTIGLTCSMLILLFVKDELSFDKFHEHGHQIYRVVSQSTFKGESKISSNTGLLEGPRFAAHVPGIKSFVRIEYDGTDFKKGTEVQSMNFFRADSNFFVFFSFPLIAGNPATCLKDPYSIVLSKTEAIRQFGSTDILGKTVLLKEDTTFKPYTVTAVAKDCPQNSSIRFNALSPIKVSAADEANPQNWFSSFLNTFVMLDDHANLGQVERQMKNYYFKDASVTFKSLLQQYGLSASEASMEDYRLQPIAAMHLDKAISSGNGISATSNPVYSYILSGIALFILLIACINFINLTIARSLKRAKEIGIRKVVGSNKKQLIIQFMGESIILCMMSFCLALLLTELLLPLFNTLANKSLSLSYLLDAGLIAALAGLFALTSFIAGFYPALVLTRFEPTKILYNRFDVQGKNYLQKSLVVVQFTIASFFVILTFVVYQQFKFLTSADLGYDDNNLVLIEQYNAQPKGAIFQKMLSENPAIKEVAAKNGGLHSTLAKTSGGAVINFLSDMITPNFLDELKIPILTGRNFSPTNPTDSIDKILVNEAFVKEAGWTAPLGQKITITPEDNKVVEVIGVVKNYHYGSMNEPINPQVFRWQDINKLNAFYIKIQPGMSSAALNHIKTTYQALFPLSPYSYNFVQQSNKMQYSDIAKWRQILLFGGLVTIIISFMGLFGLSVLSSERRRKEIGIRKVYGASVGGIIRLLTTDYLKLVLLSLIIAAPITYMAAHKFLETMLYRIPLSVRLFIIPDLLVILLAFLTIYLQTRQSATVNPVKSLKND